MGRLHPVEGVQRAEQGDTAPGKDSLLHGRLGSGHGVLGASLLLLHGALGGASDADDPHAAGQAGEALLQLLPVVVGGGPFDSGADLVDPSLDLRRVSAPVHDGGGVGVHDDAPGRAQVLEARVLETASQGLADEPGPREGGQVSKVLLLAITEAGSLHGADVQSSPDLVDRQGGQGVVLHTVGDEEERLALLLDPLEEREEVVHAADRLVVNQDQGIVQTGLHGVLVGDEVRREIAFVEAHPLDGLQLHLDPAALFDADDTVAAHGLHGLRDEPAHLGVPVGRDRGHLGDLLLAGGLRGQLPEAIHHRRRPCLQASPQAHGIGAGRHALEPFGEDGVGQDGGRGRAVTGLVGRILGHVLHHLDRHVLGSGLELDLPGHRDPVLGDGGTSEAPIQHHGPALGAQGHGNRAGELVDPVPEALSRFDVELQLLRHLFSPGRDSRPVRLRSRSAAEPLTGTPRSGSSGPRRFGGRLRAPRYKTTICRN